MLDTNCKCFNINNVHGINTTILRRTQNYIDLLLRISTAVPESNISSRNNTTQVKLHPLEEFVQSVEQEMQEQRSTKKETHQNNAVYHDLMFDKVIKSNAVNNNENIRSALSRLIADSQGSWIYRHHVQHMHNFLDTVSWELSRAIEETFLHSILQRNKHNVNVEESICNYDVHVQLLPSSVTQEVDKPSSLSEISSSLSSSPSPSPITTAILSQSNNRQSQKSRMSRMSNLNSNNSMNAFCACVVIRRRDVLERRRHGQEELYQRYMNVAAPGQTLHDALEFWRSVSYSIDYLQCQAKNTKQSSSKSSAHAELGSFDTRDKSTFDSSNIDESYGSNDQEHATQCEEPNAFIKPHSFTCQKLTSTSLSSSELMKFPLSTREVEQLRPIDFNDNNSSWYETDAMFAFTENDGYSYGNEIDYSYDDNDNSYFVCQKRINRSNSRVNNNNNNNNNNIIIKNEQVDKIYRSERDIYRKRDRDKRARVIFGSQDNCISLTTEEESHMRWQQPMQLLTTKINTTPKNAQVASNQKRARRTQYSQTKASKDWNKYIAHSECGLVAVLYVSLQSIVYVAYLNREYINENNNSNNNNSKPEVASEATIVKTTNVELQNTQKSKSGQIDEHPANTRILANKKFTMHAWMLPLESDTSFTRGLLKMS